MRSADKGMEPDPKSSDAQNDSLADQALEAIIRSQQLRQRSRNLRKPKESDSEHGDKET